MIRNKKNIIIMLISLTIGIIIVGLMFLFFFSDKKEFSETENRFLAKFPDFSIEDLKNGKYIRGLESYITDHFPFRDEFIGLKTNVLKMIGQTKIGDLYLGNDGFLLEEYNITKDTTSIPIDTLNKFYNSLSDNVNVSLMLVPTSVEIYKDKLPKYAINTSQKDVIDYVYSNIEFNCIDVYSELKKEADNMELYYKTDHHWNTFGAYIGFLSYIETQGIEKLEKPEFEKISDNFYGTFYSKLIDNSLPKDVIYKLKDDDMNYRMKNVVDNSIKNTLYFKEYLDKKDKYSYFLGENKPLLEIENLNINNNKKILVIKDSYANSMIPFLAKEYKYVYVIDPRYYRLNISDYIKDNNILEVLLVYNMQTVENDLGIGIIK